MSPEKQNAGGPAVGPPRMDQAFQLQNLHRLAMNPEATSMGQYADMYTSPSRRGQQEVSFPSDPTKTGREAFPNRVHRRLLRMSRPKVPSQATPGLALKATRPSRPLMVPPSRPRPTT